MATTTAQKNCVVLVSGGIDSAACVDFYLREKFFVSGLHIDYGQQASSRENKAASAIAKHYQISLSRIKLAGARPKSEAEFLGRNALLVLMALLEVETRTTLIALGIHSGTPYYDCSPNFISNVQNLVDGQCGGRIRIAAPFIEWTKKEIWAYCSKRKVPIELTYSCERGLSRPCGFCLSCRDLEALRAR